MLRLALGLKKIGVDTHLILDRRSLLHHPESVMAEYSVHSKVWIHDMSELDEDDYVGPTPRLAKVVAQLEASDGVILNSRGPSLLAFFSRPAISVLTGSDLDYYADHDSLKARQGGWGSEYRKTSAARFDAMLWGDFIERQRHGILHSRGVSYFRRGLMPSGDAILDDIGVSDAQRFMIYMGAEMGKEEPMPFANDIPRIFYGARVTWARKDLSSGMSPLDCKGTEVAVRGMARYIQITGKPLDIRIVKKGADIERTQQLARDCGIAQHMTWLEEMSLADFTVEMDKADICFDQMSGSVIGMVGLDAMTRGKPLIADARPDVWSDWPEPWPVCHAVSQEDVSEQLMRLLGDAEHRAEVGRKSRDFIARYFTPERNAEMVLQRLFPRNYQTSRVGRAGG